MITILLHTHEALKQFYEDILPMKNQEFINIQDIAKDALEMIINSNGIHHIGYPLHDLITSYVQGLEEQDQTIFIHAYDRFIEASHKVIQKSIVLNPRFYRARFKGFYEDDSLIDFIPKERFDE